MTIPAAGLVLAAFIAAGVTVAPNAAPHRVEAIAPETFDVGMLRVEHVGRPGGIPIIFIPALFCGPWQWQREITALSDRYDIYALTLPGFDGRPRDRGGDLMTRAANDLSRLIRTRHIDRPIIVGHSLGGTLAVLFAETHAREARAIVAVEGGRPIAPSAALRETQVAASVAPYVGITRDAFGATLRANMLQYVITAKADVDSVERRAASSDPAAVVDWMRTALPLDLTPGLHKITEPFTEIVPFDSIIDPHQGFLSAEAKRAAYADWVAHAPHGAVIMINHARHFVMVDQPSAFDKALYAAIGHS